MYTYDDVKEHSNDREYVEKAGFYVMPQMN